MTCRENLRTLGSTKDLSLLEKVANRPPLARPAQVGDALVMQKMLKVVKGCEKMLVVVMQIVLVCQ